MAAPRGCVILAGDDPSAVYVRNKEVAADKVGMVGQVHRLPASVSEEELLARVRDLNAAPEVDGILVQFPIPRGDHGTGASHLGEGRGWSPRDQHGQALVGLPGLVPCTPRGVMRLLEESGSSSRASADRDREEQLGRQARRCPAPGEELYLTLAHSRTEELPARCREADIVIAAVGKAKLVGPDWIGRARPSSTSA